MSYRRIAYLLLVANLCIGMFYVLAKPPWQGYDEPQHVEIIILLSRGHSHPIFSESGWWDVNEMERFEIEETIVKSMQRYRFWQIHKLPPPSDDLSFKSIFKGANEFHQPPLYYVFNATIVKLLKLSDPVLIMYLCRSISVLLITIGLLFMVYWLPLVFPGSPKRSLSTLALVVFWPMHGVLGASVNNDAMVECLGLIFIGLLVRARVKDRLDLVSIAGLVVVTALGLLTKATFSIAVIAILVLLFQILIKQSKHRQYLGATLKFVTITVMLVVTFLFHFSDKFNIYQLIRLPLRVLESLHMDTMIMLFDPAHLLGFVRYYFASATGVLVYGHEYLATPIYFLLAVFCLAGLLGWCVYFRQLSPGKKLQKDIQKLLIALVVLSVIQSLVKYLVNDGYYGDAHFRYAAMTYSAYACILMLGWWTVIQEKLNHSRHNYQIPVFPSLLAGVLIYQFVFVFFYFLPLFYL